MLVHMNYRFLKHIKRQYTIAGQVVIKMAAVLELTKPFDDAFLL